MLKKDKIFKIKKDFTRKILINKRLKRKFKKLKNSIIKLSERNKNDFNCIFHKCNKSFPNYTRWMLHYKMHVN